MRALRLPLFFLGIFISLQFLLSCSTGAKEAKEETKEPLPLFRRLPHERTGVTFSNILKESPELNILTFEYFANGGGVAIGDINNDDLPDLYFTGNMGPNRLYLNGGDFRFRDITKESGTDGGPGWSNGVVMEDINQDGYLDIYVCRSGGFSEELRKNQLFINNGDNTFSEKAEDFGLAIPSYSTHAAFVDYDRDGDLDMYLLNHNISAPENLSPTELKEMYDPLAGDKFLENQDGVFFDVSQKVGIHQNPIGYGLGVGISDLDKNGFPDVYICNDFLEHDYLYMNNGDGTFTEKLKDYIKHASNYSMGCDIADIDNDGLQDIFVLDMAPADNYSSKTNMAGMNPERFFGAVNTGFHYQYMINTLQWNRGRNVYSEIAFYSGLAKTDWSWAPLFYDLDNDGLKDAFVTNGYKMNSRNKDFEKIEMKYFERVRNTPTENHAPLIRELLEKMPEIKIPNYVFKNEGDLKFRNMISSWGMQDASFSNGAAFGDLDLDGDLDLVINNISQEAFIYENQTSNPSARIKLRGPKENVNGIGARITLKQGTSVQFLENYTSRGYMSSNDPIVHFGLPEEDAKVEIEVIWSDGKRSSLETDPKNARIEIDYNKAESFNEIGHEMDYPFKERSAEMGIDFLHQENDFNDFEREILLPHRMSTLGPSVSVGDINADGLDDFFVGNGAGFSAIMYLQQETGKFESTNKDLWASEAVYEDIGSAFFDLENDGDLDLYVVSGGTRREEGASIYQDRVYLNDGLGNFSRANGILPKEGISGGAVLPFDMDEDGDIDLFIGGRVIPGKYPFAPESQILENQNGSYKKTDPERLSSLQFSGMVSSAVWADINGDAKKELVVAGEWMPVLAYQNSGGEWILVDTLAPTGWWYHLISVDLNNDGVEEIICGNLGSNYKYKASESEPFHVFSGDLDGSGTNDIYLGYHQEGQVFPVRGRECSSQQMPFISEKFKSYSDFGKADIFQVLGESAEGALHLQAKEFRSGWLNFTQEDPFKPFPFEVQLSAVQGIVNLDLDRDGFQDLVMAGNLYGSEVETPRNDAGIGSVLLSENGTGFYPMAYLKSNFFADGDVKCLRKIDLANGKTGIIVARNSGRLSLFEISINVP